MTSAFFFRPLAAVALLTMALLSAAHAAWPEKSVRIISLQHATQQPPEGYTLLLTSTTHGFLIDNPKVPLDLVNAFAPAAYPGVGGCAFVAHPSLRVHAASGIGGFPHMSTELSRILEKAHGLDLS